MSNMSELDATHADAAQRVCDIVNDWRAAWVEVEDGQIVGVNRGDPIGYAPEYVSFGTEYGLDPDHEWDDWIVSQYEPCETLSVGMIREWIDWAILDPGFPTTGSLTFDVVTVDDYGPEEGDDPVIGWALCVRDLLAPSDSL